MSYNICQVNIRHRINRYIMECKFFRKILFLLSYFGINRYIMECKFVYPLQSLPPYAELIDTLWNVNVSTVIYGGYPVKKINRYIIE